MSAIAYRGHFSNTEHNFPNVRMCNNNIANHVYVWNLQQTCVVKSSEITLITIHKSLRHTIVDMKGREKSTTWVGGRPGGGGNSDSISRWQRGASALPPAASVLWFGGCIEGKVGNGEASTKNLNSIWVRDGRGLKITNFIRSLWPKDR